MSPMKPEDIEKLGRFIEGVGKTAGKVSDLAEKAASGIKEKVGPHVDRAVEALDKTFFGDKENGDAGLHDQLSELFTRMRDSYTGQSSGPFQMKRSVHPGMSDLEYTVFDGMMQLCEMRAGKRGAKGSVTVSEIVGLVGQNEKTVESSFVKLESLGMISCERTEAKIQGAKITDVGRAVYERCKGASGGESRV